MIKILITSILIVIAFNLNAQKQSSNWYFGDSCLLTFTDTSIIATKVPGYACEASASISDKEGNLLFYSEGSFAWNRDLQKMLNSGFDVDQYTEGLGSSITQGILILPFPNDSLKYYIVHISATGLKYSIIDMTLAGGLGDVIEKNIEILEEPLLMQKLIAARHGNGRDWWVLTHERIYPFDTTHTNKFYEFLITPEGISEPIEIFSGTPIGFETNWGEMIFSPDGSKLAITGANFLELFDFNRCTGSITPFAFIDNFDPVNYSAYGCSFSPDGSKLYVSSAFADQLYQYCLNCNDSIEETKTVIFENPYGNYLMGQHEVGPDGKIYLAMYYNTIPNNIFSIRNMNLCVINNPNLEGPASDFDTSTIWLGNRRSTGGLPNMVNYNLGPLIGSECDSLTIDTTTNINTNIELNEILIYPNPFVSEITLQSNNPQELIYSIKTIDGKEILHGSFEEIKSVYLNNIAAGVYLIEITNNKGAVLKSQKIIKN